MLVHPEVAFRDCQHCLEFFYEEDGPNIGKVKCGRDKQPLKRPMGCPAPCRREGGSCPKGTPEKPVELSVRQAKAYEHFRRCRITGQWPDDELVMQRAVALSELEEGNSRRQQSDAIAGAVQLAMVTALTGN
ncbi:hypothetical protein KOR42_22620 [Thalassoglobus neptunius]|uniref:Uncharacterized protein n=1 Tax=Thalassoglobus neptunius TaxID=1938619 RepID=A0A5C5X9N4_9PLAN|nr:hypothetical protein [Thalassoglobus neptunius]TWT58875.1 hypothetical protein KOR42_22620 [Thalassoglobus neptunius]